MDPNADYQAFCEAQRDTDWAHWIANPIEHPNGPPVIPLTAARAIEARLAEAEADNTRLIASATCVTCQGSIMAPMQCAFCIEHERVPDEMPARPVTVALRERLAEAERERDAEKQVWEMVEQYIDHPLHAGIWNRDSNRIVVKITEITAERDALRERVAALEGEVEAAYDAMAPDA